MELQSSLLLTINFPLLAQSWDLVQQTQNYLKLLISIINSDGKANSLPPSSTTGAVAFPRS